MIHAPGRRRRSQPSLGAANFGFYVNSATGNDGNSGTSAAAAWASMAPLRTAIDALPDNGALTAYVSGTFLDDHLRLGAGVNTGVYARITIAAGTIFNATPGVDQSFTDSTGGPWTMELIGQGSGETRPKIRVGDTGTGNGFGVTSNGGAKLIYRNMIVENCIDGASLHGSLAYGEVYDCTFRNNSKSAFAHVHTGGSFKAYRCSFEGKAAAVIGVGSETTATSANSLYQDCSFIPATSGDACIFLQATVRRCKVGTLTARVGTTGSNQPWGDANGPAIVQDSFVHACWDQNSPVTMTGCYGRATMRMRNSAVASSLTGCVFVDGADGLADSLLWRNFDPGSAAQITVRNSVLSGFAVGLGSGYGAADATYFSASGSRADYLCLFGNTTDIDADLVALGTPFVANNITSNPLLGPCNTTVKNDWAIGPTSPCIGAGLAGADIGFQAS